MLTCGPDAPAIIVGISARNFVVHGVRLIGRVPCRQRGLRIDKRSFQLLTGRAREKITSNNLSHVTTQRFQASPRYRLIEFGELAPKITEPRHDLPIID